MRKIYQEDNSQLSRKFTPPRPRYSNHFRSWLIKRYRRFYIRLVRLKENPVAMSKGLAVGVFAGCFPLFGFQTFIGIILAVLFRGSKVAAAIGTWVSDPITYIPLYVLNFKIGKFLLGVESISSQDVDLESLSSLMKSGYTFAITLLVGCFAVGVIAGIGSYFLSLYIFRRWKLNQDKFPNK